MKTIKSIDFLGKKPSLLIASHESDKTLFGGLLSIITLIGMLTGFGYFVSILLDRKTYTLVQSEKLDTSQTMNLDDFPISVKLVDSGGYEFKNEDRIFDIKLLSYKLERYTDIETNKTKTYVVEEFIPLDKCNVHDNKYIKYQKIIEKEPFSSGTCMPLNKNISLRFPFGNSDMAMIAFYFFKCQNNTNLGKTDCYPSEVIDEKIRSFYLITKFIDNYFDHSNLKIPAQPYLRTEMIPAGSSQYVIREMLINMKNIEYFTDENFLISDPQLLKFDALDSVKDFTSLPKTNYDLLTSNGSPFTSITFTMSSIKQVYERKYYKLQDMLADFGGLMNALLSITMQINLYFSDKFFFNKVIDANIYSLCTENVRKSLSIDVFGLDKKINPSRMDIHEINRSSERKNQDSKSENKHENVSPGSEKNVKNNGLQEGSPKKLTLNNKLVVSVTKREKNDVSIHSYDSASDERENNKRKNNSENHANVNLTSIELMKKTDVKLVYKNFHINFYGYVLPAFCFKKNSQTKRQLELHSKLTDIINEHLDILNISKKIHTIDKLNYVLCGDQYINTLETTNNPYLYEKEIPNSCDIYHVREKIIKAFIQTGN